MIKKGLVAGFVLFFICLVLYFFFHLKKAIKPQTDALNAVPKTAAFIFKINKKENLWKELKNNEMWKELLTSVPFQELNKSTSFLDSIINSNPEIRSTLKNQHLIISLHPTSKSRSDFLYTINVPDEASALHFLSKQQGNRWVKKIDNAELFSVKKDSGALYYSIVEGIFTSSTSLELLESSLKQLSLGVSVLKDPTFKKIYTTAGSKVEGTIFINYHTLSEILKKYLNTSGYSSITSLKKFAGWSALDINLKPNSLLLSGFTEAFSEKSFLSLFKSQQPQKGELIKILPSNTAWFLYYGLSDYKNFQENYTKYSGKNFSDSLEPLSQELISWMGNEMVIAAVKNRESINSPIIILKPININKAQKSLSALSFPNNTLTHKGTKIHRLNLSENILQNAYGSFLKDIKEPYYTTLQGYIIMSGDTVSIKNFINHYSYGYTLQNNKSYLEFSEKLSAESNVILYSAINKSAENYLNYLQPDFAELLYNNLDAIKKFQSSVFQFTTDKKLFYTNVYFKYNPSDKPDIIPDWSLTLDTTISLKPFVTISHITNEHEIFIQDDANNIYLISNSGQLLWKKSLAEKIIGEIHQVDALKNKKLQLVFNTKSHIYLIDRNGNTLPGFPLKLKAEATAPLAVLDYSMNKEYRLIIPLSDKRIYNLTLKGEKINDWTLPQTEEIVTKALKYILINNLDYLITIDNSGKVYAFDRKGNNRLKFEEKINLSSGSDFYIKKGNDLSTSFIIVADPDGKLLRLSFEDKKSETEINSDIPNPFLNIESINSDTINNVIFSGQHYLKAFKPYNKLSFQHKFEKELSHKPDIFKIKDQASIGQLNTKEKHYYLFNQYGSIYPGFPVPATSPFNIIQHGNRFLLIGANGQNISAYIIE